MRRAAGPGLDTFVHFLGAVATVKRLLARAQTTHVVP